MGKRKAVAATTATQTALTAVVEEIPIIEKPTSQVNIKDKEAILKKYRARGLHIKPLKKDKRPAYDKLEETHGTRRLCEAHNIGVILKEFPGIGYPIIFDVDIWQKDRDTGKMINTDPDGEKIKAFLNKLESYGIPSDTLKLSTGGDHFGSQFYYATERPVKLNGQKKIDYEGLIIEIKCGPGSYGVIPPSKGKTRPYKVEAENPKYDGHYFDVDRIQKVSAGSIEKAISEMYTYSIKQRDTYTIKVPPRLLPDTDQGVEHSARKGGDLYGMSVHFKEACKEHRVIFKSREEIDSFLFRGLGGFRKVLGIVYPYVYAGQLTLEQAGEHYKLLCVNHPEHIPSASLVLHHHTGEYRYHDFHTDRNYSVQDIFYIHKHSENPDRHFISNKSAKWTGDITREMIIDLNLWTEHAIQIEHFWDELRPALMGNPGLPTSLMRVADFMIELAIVRAQFGDKKFRASKEFTERETKGAISQKTASRYGNMLVFLGLLKKSYFTARDGHKRNLFQVNLNADHTGILNGFTTLKEHGLHTVNTFTMEGVKRKLGKGAARACFLDTLPPKDSAKTACTHR